MIPGMIGTVIPATSQVLFRQRYVRIRTVLPDFPYPPHEPIHVIKELGHNKIRPRFDFALQVANLLVFGSCSGAI